MHICIQINMNIISLWFTFLQGGESKKDQKSSETRKKKKKDSRGDPEEGEDMDLDNMDWWSKYHASMQTMIRVCYHGNRVTIATMLP